MTALALISSNNGRVFQFDIKREERINSIDGKAVEQIKKEYIAKLMLQKSEENRTIQESN